MLMIYFLLQTMLTMMFMLSNHPLSMGLILLTLTVTIAASTGLMVSMFWYSYILFMIMIGGMMILFLYMTSIASNKKFMISWKMMSISMVTFIVTLMMTWNDKLMHTLFYNTMNLEMTVTKFFIIPTSMMMMLLITYLLISLIAVVKITKTNFGPLRQK